MRADFTGFALGSGSRHPGTAAVPLLVASLGLPLGSRFSGFGASPVMMGLLVPHPMAYESGPYEPGLGSALFLENRNAN